MVAPHHIHQNLCFLDLIGQAAADEEIVDPPACVPLTGTEAHAPPAVHAGGVGVQVAEGIRKARGQQLAQLAALLVREARRAAIGAGVL